MMTSQKVYTAPPDIRDRCDSGCGAKALVRVMLATKQDLVFCGHHYDKMKPEWIGEFEGICDTRVEDDIQPGTP